jgi:hypothetical protein
LIGGVILLVVALVFGLTKGGWPIKPKYIDKFVMRLGGAGEPFLASLARESGGLPAEPVPVAMPADAMRL